MAIRFYTRVLAVDPSGYYLPRWGLSTPVDLIAGNADEAISKAGKVMGDPPQGRKWAVNIDRATEESESLEAKDGD